MLNLTPVTKISKIHHDHSPVWHLGGISQEADGSLRGAVDGFLHEDGLPDMHDQDKETHAQLWW